MARTSKARVTDFGPELLSALISGTKAPITITFSSRYTAQAFVFRLNQLRKAMRAEAHPFSDQVYRALVSLPRDESCSTVTIRPRDTEFADALRGAGISVERPTFEDLPTGLHDFPVGPLDTQPPESGPSVSPLDSAIESVLGGLPGEGSSKKPFDS